MLQLLPLSVCRYLLIFRRSTPLRFNYLNGLSPAPSSPQFSGPAADSPAATCKTTTSAVAAGCDTCLHHPWLRSPVQTGGADEYLRATTVSAPASSCVRPATSQAVCDDRYTNGRVRQSRAGRGSGGKQCARGAKQPRACPATTKPSRTQGPGLPGLGGLCGAALWHEVDP